MDIIGALLLGFITIRVFKWIDRTNDDLIGDLSRYLAKRSKKRNTWHKVEPTVDESMKIIPGVGSTAYWGGLAVHPYDYDIIQKDKS